MRPVLGIVSLAILSACQQPAELKADHGWVRLPAAAGRPGAAYFTVHGGDKADTLLAVSTPAALRTEMHESMKGDHGMMAMAPIKDVAVPARGTLSFAPGGRHVMLFDLGPRVTAGQRIPLRLAFAGGKTLEIQAMVVGAGDAAPGEAAK
ncbi:MAG: copper chaperone PCu(A)C [Sphingomonas sp.]|uniref:copper chaperone PCu(A)C n=1 Tax=Sphingomonas sp. TaxID=28214 RepID=UPI0025FC628C|nr:copper chaperone PCu(A)C [Sphingomonas sp.]MBX3563677.1 copper chaperone PCu(A)C [Sphingomonas sp.]